MNEVYVSIKYRYIAIFYWKNKTSFKPFVLLQSLLLLCLHGLDDFSGLLYNVSVTLSPALQSGSLMYIRGLIPRNFAELGEAVPIWSRVCSDTATIIVLIFLYQL